MTHQKRKLDAERILALVEGVWRLYAKGHEAYWLPPVVLHRNGRPVGRVRAGDSVIFCCRRGEREIQLTEAFTDPEFDLFPRERIDPLTFVPLVLYHPKFAGLPIAFPSSPVVDTLGEVVSRAGLSQLRIAEEEKFSHVTYFLDGKKGGDLPGVKTRSVPSSLDDPLASLPELTSAFSDELRRSTYDLIVMNIATGDLLGHSDRLDVKEKCAGSVDRALSDVLDAASRHGYTSFITADHGLLEEHGLPGGEVNTSHTLHPVPFIVVTPSGEAVPLVPSGSLADVAPTVLSALGLPTPEAMAGRNLVLDRSFRVGRALLVVLDGWGLPEEGHIDPIARGKTPTWDWLVGLPMARLEASGAAVGLLPGTKGNSESGHLAIGAGRAVPQDELQIQAAIDNGTYARTEAFQKAFADASRSGGAVHLLALLSRSSSHGSIEYALELVRHASAVGSSPVFLHVITDGRSSRSDHVPDELLRLGDLLGGIGAGEVVTLIGRGFALDRGRDYEGKTRVAYRALVDGTGVRADAD